MKNKKIIEKIREYEKKYDAYSHEDILKEVELLKKNSNNLNKLLPRAFALCSVAASRTLNMRPYDVQLEGGIALHYGKIAELKTGEGKSNPVDTPVPTPEGWKKVGDIKVGDYLFDRLGKKTKVLGVYPQGIIDTYELVLADGRKIKCGPEHLWSVYDKCTLEDLNLPTLDTYGINGIQTLSTKEMYDAFQYEDATYYLPDAHPALYEEKNQPVDSYVFGLFMGKREKNEFSETDDKDGSLIPQNYKTGSLKQRWQLAKGLMDASGNIFTEGDKEGELYFNTNSERLRDDFKELIYSLGYSCHCDDKTPENGKYVVYIDVPNSVKSSFFSKQGRKKDVAESIKTKPDNKVFHKLPIVSIEKLEEKTEQVCFEVDNDEHLFQIGSYIVTHNTLVATCPVFLNALTGKGVHVITVNDYLARRDSAQMSEVYGYLGMTTGCIYTGMLQEDRKAAYQCDITYGTNSEFGFDYLRDNMAKSKEAIVQRGLNYVIIDEVDSVLIDDSKTPLIISGGTKGKKEVFNEIDKVIKTLKATTNYNQDATTLEKLTEDYVPDGDYIVLRKTKEVFLTDSGIEKVETALNAKLSDDNSLLQHYVNQSLAANYTMFKNVDYVVKDNKIVIVDESTGRLMESRKYSDNLHQAIEAKEGVPISADNQTLASITYQNFFRMYDKMAGMTGTAYTDKFEFKDIYDLRVVRIPTNKPVIRIDDEDLLFPTKQQKYIAITNKVKELHAKGQPILIGTPSVEESEIVSELLRRCGFRFNVLNAKNHEKEAEIVAQAGRLNAITVATNMAGRGTDILLGGNPKPEYQELKTLLENGEIDEKEYNERTKSVASDYKKNKALVVEAGGLAVIGVERFDNRRIDDQLRGRSGRQGDPGYSQFFLSVEDRIFKNFGNMLRSQHLDFSQTSGINNRFIRNTQKMIESFNYSARKNTLDYDDVNDSQRKQIYDIRRQVLLKSDEEIVKIFQEYRSEIIKCLVRSNTDLSEFFRTKEIINRTYKDIDEYISRTIEKNKENLATHGNTVENMVRYIMLSTIDRYWTRYLNQMTSLKETVNITVMGSLKPIQLYKSESIQMFNALIFDVKKEIVHGVANIRIEPKQEKPKQKININISL